MLQINDERTNNNRESCFEKKKKKNYEPRLQNRLMNHMRFNHRIDKISSILWFKHIVVHQTVMHSRKKNIIKSLKY